MTWYFQVLRKFDMLVVCGSEIEVAGRVFGVAPSNARSARFSDHLGLVVNSSEGGKAREIFLKSKLHNPISFL